MTFGISYSHNMLSFIQCVIYVSTLLMVFDKLMECHYKLILVGCVGRLVVLMFSLANSRMY